MTAVLSPAFTSKVAYDTGCHIWTGAVNSKGYGCFAVDGVSHLAHRVAWETLRGPIPEGLTVDHTCRVRNCVNVEHLELVTDAENRRRGLVATGYVPGGLCRRGHRLTEANVYRRRNRGAIECRECRRLTARVRRVRVGRESLDTLVLALDAERIFQGLLQFKHQAGGSR